MMARSKNGEAISAAGKTPAAIKTLKQFITDRERDGDLDEWRRGKVILGYIELRKVVDLALEYGISRGSINRWLQWYEAMGVAGLVTSTSPGAPPKLNTEQRSELTALVEKGSLAAGYASGIWTGPMVGDLIEKKFGVRYHKHNVPRLLHELGFSLQRPRKRLARADLVAQETWVRERLPAIKKKQTPVVA